MLTFKKPLLPGVRQAVQMAEILQEVLWAFEELCDDVADVAEDVSPPTRDVFEQNTLSLRAWASDLGDALDVVRRDLISTSGVRPRERNADSRRLAWQRDVGRSQEPAEASNPPEDSGASPEASPSEAAVLEAQASIEFDDEDGDPWP